jgi:Tfp pilus assembly protein PilF
VYRGTGRYQEAAAEFEQAIEQEPTNDRAYMELATAYSRLGNSAQAEATYRRAIKLDLAIGPVTTGWECSINFWRHCDERCARQSGL